MEAMEMRERLHEVDTPEAVEAMTAQVREQKERALAALGTLFLQDDKPALRKALLRLRYLDKFGEEALVRRTNLLKRNMGHEGTNG